jgi:hypothetical protein
MSTDDISPGGVSSGKTASFHRFRANARSLDARANQGARKRLGVRSSVSMRTHNSHVPHAIRKCLIGVPLWSLDNVGGHRLC